MTRLVWFTIMVMGCRSSAESKEEAEALPSGGDDTSVPDTDDPSDDDTGSAEESALLLPGEFSGELATTYVYSGSLGSWEESCTGPVSLSIDAGLVVDGSGECVFASWSLGFDIEGTQEGETVSGLLISENALGRAETPFNGTRTEAGLALNFDTTHATDGESVQLTGTISASVVP